MLRRFLLEYDKTLIELQKFFGATDPVPGRDEVTDVQLVKTESGVLANFGKNVTEVYTALQGIRLPNGELKRLKNEWKNRPESDRRHKLRHSEEQPMIQGKDQPNEGKERLTQSCTNCGKTGHSISSCWKKGGGAYQEDQPAPATKKLRSQLNPTNLKAQTAANHSHAVEVRQAVQPTGAIGQRASWRQLSTNSCSVDGWVVSSALLTLPVQSVVQMELDKSGFEGEWCAVSRCR